MVNDEPDSLWIIACRNTKVSSLLKIRKLWSYRVAFSLQKWDVSENRVNFFFSFHITDDCISLLEIKISTPNKPKYTHTHQNRYTAKQSVVNATHIAVTANNDLSIQIQSIEIDWSFWNFFKESHRYEAAFVFIVKRQKEKETRKQGEKSQYINHEKWGGGKKWSWKNASKN